MYDPWGWAQRPLDLGATSASSTFTFRQHQDCASWADAVKYAIHLRVTGQCHVKPRVTHRGEVMSGEGAWQVSWIPAHHVTWNVA